MYPGIRRITTLAIYQRFGRGETPAEMRLGWLVATYLAHRRLGGTKVIKTLPEPVTRTRVAA